MILPLGFIGNPISDSSFRSMMWVFYERLISLQERKKELFQLWQMNLGAQLWDLLNFGSPGFPASLRTHKYLSMSEIIPSSLIKLVKFPVQLALNSSKLYRKILNLIFNHVCKFKNPFTTVMIFSGFIRIFELTVQNFEFNLFFFFFGKAQCCFKYNTIHKAIQFQLQYL